MSRELIDGGRVTYDQNDVTLITYTDNYITLSDVIEHLQQVNSSEVDWSQAPDNAVVYAEDADGAAAWYNTVDISANTRFGDWQHAKTHEVRDVYICKAPKFYTTTHAYTDSIRFRNTERKFKIEIVVEE